MKQERKNRFFIDSNWFLLTSNTVGLALCMYLYINNQISDRQMLGLTLALSFLSPIISAFGNLIIAYTKRDVDTP